MNTGWKDVPMFAKSQPTCPVCGRVFLQNETLRRGKDGIETHRDCHLGPVEGVVVRVHTLNSVYVLERGPMTWRRESQVLSRLNAESGQLVAWPRVAKGQACFLQDVIDENSVTTSRVVRVEVVT